MANQLNSQPTYDETQIQQYFHTIGFPSQELVPRISREEANTSKGLEFLKKLLEYQLAHIPFENLELHYSSHHSICLDVDHLFHKIVERRSGRGGYCMENNTFFGTILCSLGYQVMPVGARVSSGANMADDSQVDQAMYSAFTHTVNIITIDQRKYLVDVGFGNRGPTTPILLEHGVTGRATGDDDRGGNLFRLQREHLPQNTHAGPEQLLWVYSVRFNTQMRYIPLYCFPEVEFLPEDFDMINFFVSRSQTSFFTHQIVCSKFLVENGVFVGDITLFGKEIKQRKYGKNETLATLMSEEERVTSLKKFFGITLSQAEVKGIRGMIAAIK